MTGFRDIAKIVIHMLRGAILAFALTSCSFVLTAKEVAAPDPGQSLRDTTATAARLDAVWEAYVARFVSAAGRVVDDGNHGVSHSESQGYGMLIAAMVGDRERFDLLWNWTRAHLFVRQDGLAAWKWEPESGKVTDYQNATDGDLLIAWALIEADLQWGVPAYGERANRILDAIRRIATAPSDVGHVLKPSASQFDVPHQPDGPIINLSYWVFPALARLKEQTSDPFWPSLISSGLALIDKSRFGPRRLPAEWISIAGETVRPAQQFDPIFGYNAIRIPLYLAWAYPEDRERLASFMQSFENMGGGTPAVVDVRDGSKRERFRGFGYAAIPALLRCIIRGESLPAHFMEIGADAYYPATLHILSLLAASRNRPDCFSA
jgi:endoglucanase